MGKRSPDAPPDVQGPRRGKKPPPTEARCRLRVGKVWRTGDAILTGEELRFNTGRTGREGEDLFLHLRLDEITRAVADGRTGLLTVTTSEGDSVFELGRLAVPWKELIAGRPDLPARLGIERGARVDLVGVDDDALAETLARRGVVAAGAGPVDVLFAGAEHRADLSRLAALAPRLAPGGVLWLLVPEGEGPTNPEIAAAARDAGLVDGITVEVGPGRLAMKLTRLAPRPPG